MQQSTTILHRLVTKIKIVNKQQRGLR